MPSPHHIFTPPGVKDAIHQKAKAPQHVSVLVCSVEIHSPETNTRLATPTQWMGALPDNVNCSVLKESVWRMVQRHPDTTLWIKEQVRIYNKGYSSKYNSKSMQKRKEKHSIKTGIPAQWSMCNREDWFTKISACLAQHLWWGGGGEREWVRPQLI